MLKQTPAAKVIGYSGLFYWREKDGKRFRFGVERSWKGAAGTSLCYWRSYWEENRFESKNIGEDTDFHTRAREQRVLATCSGLGMIVARSHDKNTWNPDFQNTEHFLPAQASEFPKEFNDWLVTRYQSGETR
jgi:hypothetical protein